MKQELIPDICLMVMEWIGGTDGLMMRAISKTWLEASQHYKSISIKIGDNSKIIENAMMEHVCELILTKFESWWSVTQFKSLIVENPHLKNLKKLHLECLLTFDLFGDDDDAIPSTSIGDGISLFATRETFCNLEYLTISGLDLGNKGLIQLFTSPVLTRLKSLQLELNAFQNFGALTFGTDKLSNLTRLHLLDENIGDIQLMCKNQLFSNLKILHIIIREGSEDYLSNILTNPVWSSLEELELNESYLPDNVASIKCSLKLKHLTIHAGSIEKIKALVGNKSISQTLKYLNVGITNTRVEELSQFGSLFQEFHYIPKSNDEDDGFGLMLPNVSSPPVLVNKTIGLLAKQEAMEKPLQSAPSVSSTTAKSSGETVVLSVVSDDKKNLESRGGKTLMLNVEVIGESKFKVLSSTKSKICEVYDTICAKIGLNSEGKKYFSLSQIVYDEDTDIMNRFLDFEKTVEEENVSSSSTLNFIIKVLKKPIDIKDIQAEVLFVKQLHHFFTTRIFKSTEKQSVLMASLMIQMNFGDYSKEKHRVGFLNKIELEHLIPISVTKHDHAYWQERLLRLYKKWNGMSKKEAVYAFIDVACKTSHFGLSFFRVTIGIEKRKRSLAIGEDGLFLFDKTSIKPECWRWSKIQTWRSIEKDKLSTLEIDIVGSKDTISIESPPDTHRMIIYLVELYYSFLPDDMKTCKVPEIPSSPLIPLYYRPQKRTFIGHFTSRVEYLVRYYMEINARGKNLPLKTICRQMDDIIDDDTTLTSLKVGRGELDDTTVSFLLDPLEVCCAYKADISFPWKENLNLTSFDFGGNIIRAESGRLIDVISYFTNLTYLNISGVYLDNEKKKFLEFLKVIKLLEGLELSMCGLSHKFLKSIMDIVLDSTRAKLKILNVSKNRLDNKSLELISNSMDSFSYEHLNVSNNKFKASKDNVVKEFFRKLEPNQKLTKLDISGMDIGEKMGESLTELIAVSASLQELKMSNISINGIVFYRIGRILRTHPSLTEIDLSMNKIFQKLSNEDIEDSFFFLSSNKKIISIDISDCSIDEKQGEFIAKFMKENTIMERISIAGNVISTTVYDLPPVWTEMIEQNTCLNLYDFTNCKLSRRGIITLLNSMSKSTSAKELYLGRNLMDFSVPEIRESFKKLKLRVVDMRMMSINDKQIPLVASILTENPYIEIVNFESNQVTFNGAETFVKIVGKKTNLKKVVFVCNRIKEPEKPILFNLFITHTNINHVVL